MSAETKIVQASIPLPLAEKIDDMAATREGGRAEIVEQALREWIGREEERVRRTNEALASVDAGRVIDDEDVEAWVNSLPRTKPLPLPR
jgi:predicted transcriptional regulator